MRASRSKVAWGGFGGGGHEATDTGLAYVTGAWSSPHSSVFFLAALQRRPVLNHSRRLLTVLWPWLWGRGRGGHEVVQHCGAVVWSTEARILPMVANIPNFPVAMHIIILSFAFCKNLAADERSTSD